ncbi:MAG: serine/threonine-protein phosphatase [Candidatus Melainabacteria bacterium HGW-Melainabacteria-1]|nr:MAG: serine/threonine-protein phosphatase [Candidatus Melainabacteria bacterium HGW-Melainabacteria-1]
MSIEMAGDTHIGRKRDNNEDSFLVLSPPLLNKLPVEAVLLAADGMGGHERGEVASGNVRDVFEAVFSAQYAEFLETYKVSSRENLLDTLIHEIHRNLREMALENVVEGEQRELMGTTLTVGLIMGETLTLGHVGDSRAYLIRGDLVAQLTEDHTIAHRLVKAGKMTPEEAATSKYRNALSQALGASEKVQPDITTFPLEAGDVLLLCTDGLSRYLEDTDLFDLVREHAPAESCSKLIELANSRGGRDNITVVIAKI